ncbi:hypothetical protein HY994_00690 [Candidatus Micrarchaeota archaeon]|nr:hypothetical protein [Candidatus Micrarchaeota archaeon]
MALVNVTLSVPEETYKTMKKHPEIKWTEIMRQAAVQFAKRLEKDDPFRKYAYARAKDDWSDADELFKT